MDGLDTGFFFELAAGDDEAKDVWREIAEEDRQAAVSSISLFELMRQGLRGQLYPEFVSKIVESSGVAFFQAGVDEQQVLNRASRIAHGMGLAMADALIAASLEEIDCDTLHTGDTDFRSYDGPIEVVFIGRE